MSKMLKSNILYYIELRKTMTMKEIEKDQGISEADVYILEIAYQFYLERMPLSIALKKVKKLLNDYDDNPSWV